MSGCDWFLAPSLVALRAETNRRWPNRDKGSDGALGDASHAARKSDHNPDYSAPGGRCGVVRATDTDRDGIDVAEFLTAVVEDPRAAYVIWNKRIASATDDGTPWNWEPYEGTNDHTHHIHVSIKHSSEAEGDTRPWFKAPTPTPPEVHPLSDLTAADAALIGKAVADALTPKLDKIEQKYTVADNNYDSQRAVYEAVMQAEAAHLLAGGKPHTVAELSAAQNSLWSYARPLWAKP